MSTQPHESNELANDPEQPSTSPDDAEAPEALPSEARQKALQEELTSLIDLVGVEPFVDLLLERGFELGATDIHLDPQQSGVNLRLRLDGLLHNILHLEGAISSQLIARIKLISGMNITEKRVAQDGHIASVMLQHNRDIRVGSVPTIYGERLVLRLMPDGTRFSSLDQLGLHADQIHAVNKAITTPHGMLLSVGPVGSGKSTTMYSCLDALNNPGRSVVTIEDPVERRTQGVNQIQIDQRSNFGFVEALRGVLRQDPDIIMVGEIRDAETAHIAIRAGLMGTKVLSTLHAADTGATIDMFREFQIPRMFLADAINCIIAQRLIRKVCEKSRETYKPDDSVLETLNVPEENRADVELVRGVPSDANFHTGYFGRTGVFEVMTISSEIRQMIIAGKPGRKIAEQSQADGMSTLEQSARQKVLAGITSTEEMFRILM